MRLFEIYILYGLISIKQFSTVFDAIVLVTESNVRYGLF
jgi:hypothetical protein